VIDLHGPDSRERLLSALSVGRWADEVAAGSPYPSLDALVAAGERAAATLTDAELDEAVGTHPRIGEGRGGDDLSAAEQAGLGRRDEGVDAAIVRSNEVYEHRFGRVFLIRAAGRTREEVLEELQRRLKNDPDQEAQEAKEQATQIAALRLRTLFADDAS
jgi:2-oxo-4-hydroxy-4-carboxy-5-ureidoimidazoline decarboxylase